jgi:hypothetical protein
LKRVFSRLLDQIEARSGLWALLSLFLGIAIGIGGTITAQNVTNIRVKEENTQVGNSNVIISPKDSTKTITNIYPEKDKITFSDLTLAVSQADFDTIARYEKENKGDLSKLIPAFEEKTGNGRFAIKSLFQNCKGNPKTAEWIKHIAENGFDLNSILHFEKGPSTSLLWIAVEANAIDEAIAILENGASPNSWHAIEDEFDIYPRMAWPLEYILFNRRLSSIQKKKLLPIFIRAGSHVANVPSVLTALKEIGLNPLPSKNICQVKCSLGDNECALVEAFTKVYDLRAEYNGFALFVPETYFVAADTNIYITNNGSWFGDSGAVSEGSLMIIRISPKGDKTVIYKGDGKICNGEYVEYRSCWYGRYSHSNFTTGSLGKYVKMKPACSN